MAELLVSDLSTSLTFWCDLLGFSVAYQRPSEHFVYLQRPDNCQVMLSGRNGAWESATLEIPFGRGVLFQLIVDDITPIASRFAAIGTPLYMNKRDVWRSYGDRQGGRREIAVQDPDGYLILLAQDIGTRHLATE